MEQNEQELLHNIDKRLAVVEILMEKQFESLEKIEKAMSSLQIRVAGVAATVSILMAGAMKFL